jgi:hypothetical protein
MLSCVVWQKLADVWEAIALMMLAAGTSETLVNFHQTARRNIPEDSHLCLSSSSNSIRAIKQRTVIWADYVDERMENPRNPYKMLVGKSAERRSLEKRELIIMQDVHFSARSKNLARRPDTFMKTMNSSNAFFIHVNKYK